MHRKSWIYLGLICATFCEEVILIFIACFKTFMQQYKELSCILCTQRMAYTMAPFLYIFTFLALAYYFGESCDLSLEKRNEEALAGRGYNENQASLCCSYYWPILFHRCKPCGVIYVFFWDFYLNLFKSKAMYLQTPFRTCLRQMYLTTKWRKESGYYWM